MRPEQQPPSDPCWLRYQWIDEATWKLFSPLCDVLVTPPSSSIVLQSAIAELLQGIRALFHKTPTVVTTRQAQQDCLLLTLTQAQSGLDGACDGTHRTSADGYSIRMQESAASRQLTVTATSDKGLLYGVFALLRLWQTSEASSRLPLCETPCNPLRMINHWDNLDGSIERGYAGDSLFFHANQVAYDPLRVRTYARLLASVGINAIAINNVNVHQQETRLITKDYLPAVARLADIFRAYGITLFLSVNFASPLTLSDMTTADPLSPEVAAFWQERTAEIYNEIPDFGGFVVKADSEHRPGPFTYGRTHSEGANMLADALAPYHGLVIWRCFVYNCVQDWRDRQTDRARAAYDHFAPLDGSFRDNVVLQVKNGPMDFQVREPVSPLIGALPQTNQLLEVQITQEYTGQQRHLCYLVPQWKEVLDFDTGACQTESTVAQIVSGALFKRPYGGLVGVSNVGLDTYWTGHPLAQANLYGYGRLAWNPALTAKEIAQEWALQTFGQQQTVQDTVTDLLLSSWSTYESYTAPLGVGWMVNPGHHYGPNVDGYEYSRWGTYHYADCHGIGVDRTARTGTGYAAQYHSAQAALYESRADCPDELLLFFHHVPYTHRLHSGKTVIQHIYDAHFEGAQQAARYCESWRSLRAQLDLPRYLEVLRRLEEQAEHAREWRDVINAYFARKSGIADSEGREIYGLQMIREAKKIEEY